MRSPSEGFPYDGLPERAIWKRSVAPLPPEEIDPQGDVPFTIDRSTRVASAGSCFALRVAAALQQRGYNYLVTEPGPAPLTAEERLRRGYGEYSARFGNVYTTVQALQLLQRALGLFNPTDDIWDRRGGGVVDALRPRVEPGGFATVEALRADRAAHLEATRRMFAQAEVLVFTLGLTESWRSTLDGTAYPVLPGREFGSWSSERYRFENLGVAENVRALRELIELARTINPGLRVILTVSPVPLIATKEPTHVLAATTYSKSVLRVAAEELCRTVPEVAYFASYEIALGTFSPQTYFEDDRRTITAAGVDRIMSLFFRHFATPESVQLRPGADQATRPRALGGPRLAVRTIAADPCDEDLLGEYIEREFQEHASSRP